MAVSPRKPHDGNNMGAYLNEERTEMVLWWLFHGYSEDSSSLEHKT